MTESERPPEIPQEDDRVRGRLITTVSVVAVMVALVAATAATWIDRRTRLELGRPIAVKPGPMAPREISMVEQTLIESDRHGLAVRTRQKRLLERYGWADRARGVAQIPIEQAMELVVQQSTGRPKQGGNYP